MDDQTGAEMMMLLYWISKNKPSTLRELSYKVTVIGSNGVLGHILLRIKNSGQVSGWTGRREGGCAEQTGQRG